MKKGFNYILILALVAMVLNACSVEKRRYNRGFNVEWSKRATRQPQKPTADIDIPKTGSNTLPTTSKEDMAMQTAPAPVEVNSIDTPVSTETASVDNANTPGKVVKPYAYNASKNIVGSIAFKGKKAPSAHSPSNALLDDKVVAILFCIFLGWLGIHRFFLGYNISAIIMIALFLASVVLGGFVLGYLGYICGVVLFVWIIVDLIFLILDKPLFFPS